MTSFGGDLQLPHFHQSPGASPFLLKADTGLFDKLRAGSTLLLLCIKSLKQDVLQKESLMKNVRHDALTLETSLPQTSKTCRSSDLKVVERSLVL